MEMTKRMRTWFLPVLVILIAPMTLYAENEVEIHGFMAQGYMKSSDNNYLMNTDEGTYEFNEFGLNFQYFASDKLSIGAQLGARDLGDVGNDKVGISWAYGDYRWRDWLGFRAGITKGTTALYNETRDVDALRPWILLPQSVYNEGTRDASEGLKGLTIYGNVDMESVGLLSYSAKIANLQMGTDTGSAEGIKNAAGLAELSSLDFSTMYSLSFRWNTPLEGLLIGTDGIFFEDYSFSIPYSSVIDLGGGNLVVYTTDVVAVEIKNLLTMYYSVEYTYQNLVLAAEIMTSDRTTVGSGDTKNASWYVSAAYRFNDWFEAGTYYAYNERDSDLSGPDNELKDITVSTRFDISPHMTVKFETHFMDGLYLVGAGDDGTADDSWILFAAKVSYNF